MPAILFVMKYPLHCRDNLQAKFDGQLAAARALGWDAYHIGWDYTGLWLVGAEGRALALVAELEATMDAVRARAAALPRRPRVYFEEWDEPPISAVGWVSELVAIAGGEDVFAERACHPGAAQRILADPLEAARAKPDIVVGSWCGKRFRPERVAERPGWEAVPAVRDGELHEVKSALILAPGPVAIREGLPALAEIIARWARRAFDGYSAAR